MIGIPIFEDIVSQISEWIFTDQVVTIIVAVFAVVVGLTFFGAKRMEEN